MNFCTSGSPKKLGRDFPVFSVFLFLSKSFIFVLLVKKNWAEVSLYFLYFCFSPSFIFVLLVKKNWAEVSLYFLYFCFSPRVL